MLDSIIPNLNENLTCEKVHGNTTALYKLICKVKTREKA